MGIENNHCVKAYTCFFEITLHLFVDVIALHNLCKLYVKNKSEQNSSLIRTAFVNILHYIHIKNILQCFGIDLLKGTLACLHHCLCLRVQPPSWKLKNPREQRSHLGPATPGWHRHWPVSSQSNDLEPNELQLHGRHLPPVLRPWVFGCRNTNTQKACEWSG